MLKLLENDFLLLNWKKKTQQTQTNYASVSLSLSIPSFLWKTVYDIGITLRLLK